MDENNLVALENNAGNWLGHNRETEAGDYLPNEHDGTCGNSTMANSKRKKRRVKRVVGGLDAKIGEFPLIAALGMYTIIYL